MRIGLVQMDIVWEDIQANEKKAEGYFAKAGKEGVDILVFPEMSLTGFSMNVEKTTKAWREQVDFFCRMTKKYAMTAVFGYPVKKAGRTIDMTDASDETDAPDETDCSDDRIVSGPALSHKLFENHLAIVDQGNILMDYAKIHPFSYGKEAQYFRGGDRICVTCWQDTVLGGFVCYDLRFPEVFQISSDHSEIIFVIANWPHNRIAHWDILLQARAIENQCYIVGVNRAGDGGGLHYNGHSAVYAPTGERITALTEEEALLVADMDLEKVREYRKGFPAKKDRRKELYYGNLSENLIAAAAKAAL